MFLYICFTVLKMNKTKFIDIGVTILGVVVTILSGKVAERKMREAVKEEVENQLRSEEN